MKQMRKFLILLSLMFTMILFLSVNAQATTISSSSEPTYNGNDFIANGTPITISASGNDTIISWEGGSVTLTDPSSTVVYGGYYNPATETGTTVDIPSTSITMTSGTVKSIVGGNFITKANGIDYSYYDKINVDTIDITITGGTFTSIFGLTTGSITLGTAYYANIEDFYTAGTVNVSVSNATGSAIYVTSSYTYVKTANITLDKATLTGSYGITPGVNGKISTLNININASTVTTITSGFRAMIDAMNVTITGTSTIGDIFAGSYYPKGARASDSSNWNGWGIGGVNYGQVGEMTFDFGENVTYNNIYAGFQYVDKEQFETTYAGNDALTTVAAGISGSETAPITINIYTVPSVTDSGLMSMIDNTLSYVTLNYLTVAAEVEETTTVGDVTVTVDSETTTITSTTTDDTDTTTSLEEDSDIVPTGDYIAIAIGIVFIVIIANVIITNKSKKKKMIK